ncbi:MAG: anti-sigma factor family protein [Actinomycetota bacterium]
MSKADELSCKELVELVTNYLEGRLEASEAGRFEAHLQQCEGCANYLDQMGRTIVVTGALSEESVGERARNELMKAFRAWKQRGTPSPET